MSFTNGRDTFLHREMESRMGIRQDRLAADLDFTDGVSEVYVILDDEVRVKTLC